MKSTNVWKYGFNWGSIVGAVYFVFHVCGSYLGFESSLLWKFIASLIVVLGIAWSMINYKRNVLKQNISFGKLFLIGLIMSFVISFFLTLYWLLYTVKINPSYFSSLIQNAQRIYDDMGVDIDIEDNEGLQIMAQIVMYPVLYIVDFIGNIFYCLLLSFFVSNQKMDSNSSNINNDYTPYKDIQTKQEDSEKEETETEKEADIDNDNEQENKEKE